MSDISIDIDLRKAMEAMSDNAEALDESGEEIVTQLSLLAERFMKAEAPEGTGYPNVHLRDTIKPVKSRDGHKAVIMPRKRTDEGWLLHKAIVGNPSTPTYGATPPPVWSDGSGNAQGPLARWAAAKLGDSNDAWRIQKSIQADGQTTFPNRFIDRSVRRWNGRVDDIADGIVRENIE